MTDRDHLDDLVYELDADARAEREQAEAKVWPPFATCCDRPTVHWHIPPAVKADKPK